MKTTTTSILRKELSKYIEQVIESNETVLVNRRDDGAVIISLKEYTRLTTLQRVPAEDLGSLPAKNAKYHEIDLDEI